MPGTYRMGPAGLAADGPSRDGVHGQTCPDAPIPAPRDLEAGNPIHPGSPVEPSPCTEPPGVATRGWDVDGGGDAGAQTPPPPSQAGGPVRERPEREAASRPASGAPRIPGGADGVWPWSRPPVGGGATTRCGSPAEPLSPCTEPPRDLKPGGRRARGRRRRSPPPRLRARRGARPGTPGAGAASRPASGAPPHGGGRRRGLAVVASPGWGGRRPNANHPGDR